MQDLKAGSTSNCEELLAGGEHFPKRSIIRNQLKVTWQYLFKTFWMHANKHLPQQQSVVAGSKTGIHLHKKDAILQVRIKMEEDVMPTSVGAH